MAGFQGWANWETWQMALILDMNEDFDETVIARIKEGGVDESEARTMIRDTAAFVSDYIYDQLPEVPFPWSAFFDSAINQVNWNELAENYLKEWKFLTKKGERRKTGPKEWTPES